MSYGHRRLTPESPIPRHAPQHAAASPIGISLEVSVITPAMKKWCGIICDGARIRKIHETLYVCTGRHGFTYVMGNRLEDAGLVTVADGVLQLTAAGVAACEK